jgi:hypothetical protein
MSNKYMRFNKISVLWQWHVLFALFLVSVSIAQAPQISALSVNSQNIALYDKFEAKVGLANVSYSNPYNPDDVDIRAVFTAPSGKTWEIFGFYDNYSNANAWKVRFAPNETGTWSYFLTLNSQNGPAQSADSTFEAVDSEYHGWIRVSPVNPHYLIYDDGRPFYGVGPYYPWNVTNTSTGLGQLEATGCNFWGYWNIMYDGGEIIESVNSGIGRYDQPKCGRIDQLIAWSEQRDLKMMLAIWPHDLLSNTVWAHQWHRNPYKNVCAVEDFFESEVAWQYQEHQYRYIIARWGYSRALAVWEIVNEINGTDAWVAGKSEEARQWTAKVHDFLTANDPHQRPTTASMSGGQYWPAGYAEVDIPNVHVYETGWPAKYLANPLRSSAYTYFMLARQFWNNFDKPAIFGEAGYLDSYGDFVAGSDEYTAMFHNALWASWAGGMAATPVWWAFDSKQIMTSEVMEQMRCFAEVARDYNYAGQNFEPYLLAADNCDVYAMRSDSSIFGWIREEYGKAVKKHIIQFKALRDTSYSITWYDTWTAKKIAESYLVGVDTLVTMTVPEAAGEIPDVAFFLDEAAEGVTPAQLIISSATSKIYVKRDEQARLLCTIHDAEGRFVRSAVNPVQFSVKGPGHLIGNPLVNAETGMALILFAADSASGTAAIIAASPGLIPDTLFIEVTNHIQVDDFEGYDSWNNLDSVWFIRSGTTAQIALAASITGKSGNSLNLSYAIGGSNAPYAGVLVNNKQDLYPAGYLEFWLQGDASGRTLSLLVNEKNGRYWQYDHVLTGSTPELLSIPLENFTASDTAQAMRLDEIDEISFNILQGAAGAGQGAIYLDDINFVIPSVRTSIDPEDGNRSPVNYLLMQNYPNPFNNSTTIRYILAQPGEVTMDIYNSTGRRVDVLLHQEQQNAGTHSLQWQNAALASGVYFYRIQSGKFEAVKKCLLLK